MNATIAPRRVRLSRERGWRMPSNTVIVSRPSTWGNRYRVGVAVVHSNGRRVVPETVEECVQLFEEWLKYWVTHADRRVRDSLFRDLRGKNLACWCPPGRRCHADVLLEQANQPEPPDPVRLVEWDRAIGASPTRPTARVP